ncbi:MAG: ABC transporter ATP-binding protein [Proteobacteria bacterium]|jgi:branched-chain amino acid transport system ATP-binding protein|nr:ABC transporter ATP-binding protein [Pseudomonadota bacterium]
MSAVLRTAGLSKRWGAFYANRDVSVAFEQGARHALIGPNGAGKTTFIDLLTGTVAPSAGRVYLDGDDITTLAPHRRVKRGIARTFQASTLFPSLTVLESVMLAVCEREGRGGAGWRALASETAASSEALAILDALHLGAESDSTTRTLAYGKQRLLEIALALATRPRMLLLDEPAAGIPAKESVEVLGAIARLPREVTVVFIEHDMDLVFRFAERITVLVAGSVLAEGAPDEIAADPRVREVYLGEIPQGEAPLA